MELTLSKEQKKYLDQHGPFDAETLQRIYKKSVQDQQNMLKQAETIRAKRKRLPK